jgi:ribosomal protein S25
MEAPGYHAKLDREEKLAQIRGEVQQEKEIARSAALVQELNVRVGLSQ